MAVGSWQRLLALVTMALFLVPGVALANDFQNVYREYKRTGTIKPCKFSDRQLLGAQRETPPDVEQYAPSFLDALQNAREHSGDCNKKKAAATTPPPAAATPPAPTPSNPTPVPQQTAAATIPAPTSPTPAPPSPTSPHVAGVPSPPVSHPERHDSAPAAVWLLAALGALALIAALFAAAAWWFGWSAERFTRPFRASSAEFADRARDFRLELTDWLRTGA